MMGEALAEMPGIFVDKEADRTAATPERRQLCKMVKKEGRERRDAKCRIEATGMSDYAHYFFKGRERSHL